MSKVSQETIAAFLHACEHGEESIECKDISYHDWEDVVAISISNVINGRWQLRIKPEPEIDDYVDWSHLSPDIVAIARDENDGAYGYTTIPMKGQHSWRCVGGINLRFISSYKRGNKPWDKSLVRRPT